MSCSSVRSPSSAYAGPGVGERRADRGRHRAVDARDAPVGQHRDVRRAAPPPSDTSRIGFDEPTTSSAPPGSASDQRPGQPQAAGRGRRRRGRRRAPWPRRGPRRASVAVHAGGGPPATARRRPPGRSRRRRSSCRPSGSARAYTATRGSASSRCTGRCRVGRPATTTWAGRSRPGSAPSSHGPARRPASHTPRRRLGDHRQPPLAHLGGGARRRRPPASAPPGRAAAAGPATRRPRHRGPRAARRAGPPERLRPSGTSGSAKGRLRCTGPGGVPSAAATARRRPRATARSPARGRSPDRAVSASRTASPKIPGWTTVWFAPVPISCGGRSAVSTSSGTPGVRRLQDGRVQVRHGRARRRHHGHRPPRPQREAQREEAGGALVDPHVQPQPSRRRPRRAARTRAARCGSRGRARRR